METMQEIIETIIDNYKLIVAIIVVTILLLWPSGKEKRDYELSSRVRYKKTAELDEQLKLKHNV